MSTGHSLDAAAYANGQHLSAAANRSLISRLQSLFRPTFPREVLYACWQRNEHLLCVLSSLHHFVYEVTYDVLSGTFSLSLSLIWVGQTLQLPLLGSNDFQFLWWLCGLPCSGHTDSTLLSVKVTQDGRQSCTDGCNTVASDAEGLAIYDDGEYEVLPLQLLVPKICTSVTRSCPVTRRHRDFFLFCTIRAAILKRNTQEICFTDIYLWYLWCFHDMVNVCVWYRLQVRGVSAVVGGRRVRLCSCLWSQGRVVVSSCAPSRRLAWRHFRRHGKLYLCNIWLQQKACSQRTIKCISVSSKCT